MKKITSTFFLLFFSTALFAQPNLPTKVVKASGNGTGSVTWSPDTVYVLDGFVFVNEGQILTIEAGTVVKGKTGQGSNASALIIARGAQIVAAGTEEKPIIFTTEFDDVENPFDIAPNTVGQWGGIIILGKASLNTNPDEQAIEGIPTTESRGLFGAVNGISDDDDNSGVFQYVSIRHGGTNIGSNNEINGLTMGGVGRGTTIDHVEVIFNQDDAFEWFGGTVNCSHLIAAFCGDDSYDYDMGWRGKGQFFFAIQSDAAGSDRIGEHDGGTDPETGTPLATPVIYNATYIGRGPGSGKRMLTFRDNAGGEYHNSIFYDQDKGIDIEILGNGSEDSYTRLQNGELVLGNNIFWNMGDNDNSKQLTVSLQKFGTLDANGNPDPVAIADSTQALTNGTNYVQAYFDSTGQKVADPKFPSISRTEFSNQLDPRPTSGVALFLAPSSPEPNDGFFQDVDYKGAFPRNAGGFWADEWTYMDQLGYFPDPFPFATELEDALATLPGLKFYPNPNRGLFTLAGEELSNEGIAIEVLDLSGRSLLREQVQPYAGKVEHQVDIRALSAGMYLVKIVQGTQISLQQIVKQ